MRFYSHIALALMIISLAACQPASTGPLETQVAATILAGQTETALVIPTVIPSPTKVPPTATPTVIPPTNTPTLTNTPAKNYKDLKVGFSNGCGNGTWDRALASSIVTTASQLGVSLRFYDASCNIDNQLMAIRKLIDSKVDVIGINPVRGSSANEEWKTVLSKAQAANIPVILVGDNLNNISDTQYASYLAWDFVGEGRMAGAAMGKLLNGQGNVIEVAGPSGLAVSDDRKQGFLEALQDFPNIKIIDSMNGDGSLKNGNKIMSILMKSEGDQIAGVYFFNDDMMLGGIQAIKAAGKKPGKDIKIVSIDGERNAFLAMINGDLNATVECNPWAGPQFFELAFKAANSQEILKLVYVKDNIYYAEQAKDALPKRKW